MIKEEIDAVYRYIKSLSKDDQYMAKKGRPRCRRGRGNIAPAAHTCALPKYPRSSKALTPAERWAKNKAKPGWYEKFKAIQRERSRVASAVAGVNSRGRHCRSSSQLMRMCDDIAHDAKQRLYDWLFGLCKIHHIPRTMVKNGSGSVAMYCKKCKALYRADKSVGHKRKGVGKIRAEDYRAIMHRDGACLKCGCSDNLTVDHIKPVAHGGTGRINNLQVLCHMCNSTKEASTADYRAPDVVAEYGGHD